MKQWDQAVADFSKSIELRPNDPSSWNSRGAAHANLGQWVKAIADYSKALQLDPKNAQAWEQRAPAHERLQQWEQAIADFSKAIELAPNNARTANNLAWLLATCPDSKFRDAARAVALAKKAVELAPKEGNFWKTLGAAQYRAGDWKAAIEALNKSMQLRKGGDAYDWFFQAMAHWQLGNKEEARKRFDQAVKWMEKNQPKDEELRRFRGEAAMLIKP